jgi:group I intron endonuclease
MTCGIYCIENKINGKKYIGSSLNCEHRFKQHKKELRNLYHANDHLQKAVNKYGIKNFEFGMQEVCDKGDLLINEDFWIEIFKTMDSRFGYNKRSADRTIMTQEVKDNIKKSHNTPEYKKWLTKNAKENVWGNEEVKKRLIKNQWTAMHTDEHRKLKSDQRKEAWDNNPQIKKEFGKLFKEKWKNNESPSRNIAFKKWRGSKEQKEKMAEVMKARWEDKDERERLINQRKKFGKTIEFKNKMSKINKEKWANKKFKKMMSDKKKEKWKDPKFKKMMIEAKHKNLGTSLCKVCGIEFKKNIHNQTICSKHCKYVLKNQKRKNNLLIAKKNNSSVRAYPNV